MSPFFSGSLRIFFFDIFQDLLGFIGIFFFLILWLFQDFLEILKTVLWVVWQFFRILWDSLVYFAFFQDLCEVFVTFFGIFWDSLAFWPFFRIFGDF